MQMTDYELPDGPRLNLGCGPVQPEHWVNIDGSNRCLLASKLHWLDALLVSMKILPATEFCRQTVYCNLLRGLPYRDNSVACIYAGELWEHFEYADACAVTQECYRILAPGGVLRVCVPDGPTFWKGYLELYEAEHAKPRHMWNTQALNDHVQMFFDAICTRKSLFQSIGAFHKWNYDKIQLIGLFEQAGFSDVDRTAYHDSRIPDIEQVERSDFLIVEGVKQ